MPIKQGNNFVFNGVDRIDFEDADSTLHFFFPEDVAYALADSANHISVTRVFSSQRGKDYVLVGVPFSWVDSAPKGTLVIDPTTTASASDDTWLEGTTINGNITQFLIGKAYGFPKKRALLKFNLSGVPTIPAPTIVNAQMKLYYYTSNSGTGGAWVDRWVQAHQVLVNWNEAQATRDNRLTSTPWNVQYVGLNDVDAKSGYESNNLFQTGQTGTWKVWDLTALTHKWVNGTATNYGVVLWATNEATDGHDLRFYSSEYIVDPTKQPKLEIIYSQQAKTVYFLKDHLGSIRATVQDTVGAPVRGYDDYDPWGYILAGRSLASSILPTTTRNKFTEKEWDDEFGLNWLHFKFRAYDSQIGRWLSVDPVQQLSNSPYVYVANNPLRLIDLFGADTTKPQNALAPTPPPLPPPRVIVRIFTAIRVAVSTIGAAATSALLVLATPGDANAPGTQNSSEDNPQSADKSDDEENKIYRLGSGTSQNLTPQEKDQKTGLSYTTNKPAGVKYTETTLQAVNATGELKAVIDNPTTGHVSVTPLEFPNDRSRMNEWIQSRPTANTNPHQLTLILQSISRVQSGK